MSEPNRHLDCLAAERAQAIIDRTKAKAEGDPRACEQGADDVDNLVTKTLGVLLEEGIYASALYLLSRTQSKEQEIAAVVIDEMLNLLANLHFSGWDRPVLDGVHGQAAVVLKYLSNHITGGSLERLLLARETLQQMLVYARYGAKARSAEEG